MAEELEKLHADALAEVAAKLRAHPAVKALVPDHVFGHDQQEDARQWARCVIVQPGKNYGFREQRKGQPALLCQRDALVIMRAENQAVLDMLAVAVVLCLNGEVSKVGFEQCIHTSSQDSADGPGNPPEYRERRDRYGLHIKQPKAEGEVQAIAPPPTRITRVPINSPARARSAKPVETPKSEGGD